MQLSLVDAPCANGDAGDWPQEATARPRDTWTLLTKCLSGLRKCALLLSVVRGQTLLLRQRIGGITLECRWRSGG